MYIFCLLYFEYLNNIFQNLWLTYMSLSYCLCKFVIISAVYMSKPTYRFTAIEQGREIYVKLWRRKKRRVLFMYDARPMPILRDIIKSKVSSIFGKNFLCRWIMSTGNLNVTYTKSVIFSCMLYTAARDEWATTF
jgi:hypothetical protein